MCIKESLRVLQLEEKAIKQVAKKKGSVINAMWLSAASFSLFHLFAVIFAPLLGEQSLAVNWTSVPEVVTLLVIIFILGFFWTGVVALFCLGYARILESFGGKVSWKQLFSVIGYSTPLWVLMWVPVANIFALVYFIVVQVYILKTLSKVRTSLAVATYALGILLFVIALLIVSFIFSLFGMSITAPEQVL